METRLHRTYFRQETAPEGNGAVTYKLTDGEWIRLFGKRVHHGSTRRAPSAGRGRPRLTGARTLEWARRWAAEHLWMARKA